MFVVMIEIPHQICDFVSCIFNWKTKQEDWENWTFFAAIVTTSSTSISVRIWKRKEFNTFHKFAICYHQLSVDVDRMACVYLFVAALYTNIQDMITTLSHDKNDKLKREKKHHQVKRQQETNYKLPKSCKREKNEILKMKTFSLYFLRVCFCGEQFFGSSLLLLAYTSVSCAKKFILFLGWFQSYSRETEAEEMLTRVRHSVRVNEENFCYLRFSGWRGRVCYLFLSKANQLTYQKMLKAALSELMFSNYSFVVRKHQAHTHETT